MKNFTLLKLLIVISILSILSSILLPSISQSRAKARSAVCMPNLRNMHIATFKYSQDNRGSLPYAKELTDMAPVWWKRQLIKYFNPPFNADNYSTYAIRYRDEIGQEAFVCPSVNNNRTDHKAGGYGWNWFYLGNAPDAPESLQPKKIFSVEDSENTFTIGDSTDSLLNWYNLVFSTPSRGNTDIIGQRHPYGINILTLNGGVRYLKKQMFYPVHMAIPIITLGQ